MSEAVDLEELPGDVRSECALCGWTREVLIAPARVCQQCTRYLVAGWARRGKIASSPTPDPRRGPPNAAGGDPPVLTMAA